MGVIEMLIALYPRSWRERYGDEYAALLEDTGVNARVVANVVVHALALQVRFHRTFALTTLAVATSVLVELVAVRVDLTDNILWPPSTVARAVALVALLLPWIALTASFVNRRSPDRT